MKKKAIYKKPRKIFKFGGKLELLLNIIAFLTFMDAKLKVQKKSVSLFQNLHTN